MMKIGFEKLAPVVRIDYEGIQITLDEDVIKGAYRLILQEADYPVELAAALEDEYEMGDIYPHEELWSDMKHAYYMARDMHPEWDIDKCADKVVEFVGEDELKPFLKP